MENFNVHCKNEGEIIMKFGKIVLMPIEVPVGVFCWGKTDGDEHCRICSSFDNESGINECTRGFIPGDYDDKGRVKKPIECLNLNELKE